MLSNTSSLPPPGVDESSFFRFVFVRHPLRRLVSAYLSKFVRAARSASDEERRAYHRPLLRFLRRRSKEGRLPRHATFGFPDFVDFVADEVTRGKMSHGTFHWAPLSRMCALCEFRWGSHHIL